MRPQIFINVAVRDLNASMDFYSRLGFVNQPHFTDETAACMKYSDEIFLMLLTHAKFAGFTDKPIADTRRSAAAILSLSAASPGEVDSMLETALAAGAKEPSPKKDYGFMTLRSFEDPDGHLWEVFHMDPTAIPPQEK